MSCVASRPLSGMRILNRRIGEHAATLAARAAAKITRNRRVNVDFMRLLSGKTNAARNGDATIFAQILQYLQHHRANSACQHCVWRPRDDHCRQCRGYPVATHAHGTYLDDQAIALRKHRGRWLVATISAGRQLVVCRKYQSRRTPFGAVLQTLVLCKAHQCVRLWWE